MSNEPKFCQRCSNNRTSVGEVAQTLTTNFRLRWIRLCGVVAVALIIIASVMLPTNWEQLRTGHWAVEHFIAYFVAASIVCLGWRRPFLPSRELSLAAAALLEVLQSLTPNHSANLLAVLSEVGGALAAALLTKVHNATTNETLFCPATRRRASVRARQIILGDVQLSNGIVTRCSCLSLHHARRAWWRVHTGTWCGIGAAHQSTATSVSSRNSATLARPAAGRMLFHADRAIARSAFEPL